MIIKPLTNMINDFETNLEYEAYSQWEEPSHLFQSELDMRLLNMTYSLKGMNDNIPMSEDNRFRTDDQIGESIYRIMETLN
jgi:hypothetical protein